MAEGNRIDWRELCAAAAKEPDSEKLADLVDEIIKALDAQKDSHPERISVSCEAERRSSCPPAIT
jgi:hypothetical protein